MRKILASVLVTMLALFAALGSLYAQDLKVVKWEYSVKKVSDTEYDLLIKAKIDKGWHLYSQFIGEGGPVATTFTFTPDKNYTLKGKVEEKGDAEKVHDTGFDMDLTYFSGEVVFVQRIKADQPPKKVQGTVEYMTCDDSRCLPPEQHAFTIDVKKCLDAQDKK